MSFDLTPHLRPFQTRFLARALAEGIDTAALSLPRGNGKSSLAAHLAKRALTPGDPLFRAGAESHIVAASVGQARRSTFRLLREMVGEEDEQDEYRINESVNIAEVRHKKTSTRVSVMAPSGRTGQGLVRAPIVILDEPGAWQTLGGEQMYDAVLTAQGKPGCHMRALFIGTLAPAMDGWWPELVLDGSGDGTFVTCLQGADVKRWDDWNVIRACNPLMASFAKSRKKLLQERDKARRQTRHKSGFLSFRLNLPTAEESKVLLTVDEWDRVEDRPVGGRHGQPIVGVDLGGGRAWSAAVGVWPSGRIEAVAVAPGIPDIAAQEKRDRVSRGTYSRLVDAGLLVVDHGFREQRVQTLLSLIAPWRPAVSISDRFRYRRMQDCRPRWPVLPRVTRYSEATADIEALRRMAADGPLSVTPESAKLIAASLAVAVVKREEGNSRLVKRGTHNQCRDDVAQALTLAAGARDRAPAHSRGTRILIAG